MKKIGILLGVLSLFYFAPAPLDAAEKIRVANGGFGTAINAVLPAAYHQKIFQKYGLEAEYVALDSGTMGMQTLLANEIQILFSTGALAVSSNLQGADATIFGGGLNFFPFKLVVRPDIKAAADLQGKKLAVSRFGSASDFAVQQGLEKLGVDPKQVTLLQLGGNPSRLAAMNSGTVQGSVFSEPFATVAIQQFGMHSLLDLAESGIPFPENCFMVKRSFLTEKRKVVVNALKASIEALYLMRKDKSIARNILRRYLRIDDEKMLDIGYEYYLVRHGENILTLPDRKGLEFVIAQTARTNPKAKGQTPESLHLLESSVLEGIKKSGFVEKVKQEYH